MKTKKFKEEISQMDLVQLIAKAHDLRRELFGLRLSMITSHVKDYSVIKKLRKNIARTLTMINQKTTN